MAAEGSIKVIAKVGRILRAFLSCGAELSLQDIAANAELELSTASRITGSLVSIGLLRYDSVQRIYSPGLMMLELSRVILNRFTFREIAHREMISLSRRHDWLVYLTVVDEISNAHVIYIDTVSTTAAYLEQSQVGQRRPLHTTATGKLFLTYLHIPISSLTLDKRTPYSKTDPAALQADIDAARERGYAIACNEEQMDVCGVAAPILDKTGQIVASLGVSTTQERFVREQERMIVELQEIANGISSVLRFGDGLLASPAGYR